MAHLSKDFVVFFEDLAKNNNRDWFLENKKRYENIVKKPFQNFISELIDALKEEEPDISISQKEAIFRIYRDVRFSKDKTPYKLHASAFISTTHKKDYANPNGLYLEINPDFIRQYGGVYAPDKDTLLKIRTGIATQNERFQTLITDKQFVNTFGEIRGEQNKRIPKEFKAIHAVQPLIANKQFYYYTEMSVDKIDSDDLIPMMIRQYKIAKPVNEFLAELIKA